MFQNLTYFVAGIISLLYPIYILAIYKKVIRNIKHDEKYRLIDYKQTILIFWVLVALILVNFWNYGEPDLNFYPKINLINGVLVILILGFAYFQNKPSLIRSENEGALREKMRGIYFYLPSTKNELNWFMVLSMSAGICEEIIFRMFLFEFFLAFSPLIAAVIATNILFAISHITTGKKNLISAFILGLLFSCIYYFTENIWIAMLLHITIDINSGVLGYRLKNRASNMNN